MERDRCAPEDFYSTSNHHTSVRIDGELDRSAEPAHGRHDRRRKARYAAPEAFCRRLRDLKAGDMVVTGMRGIRVAPESKERDRLAFAFMSNDISSERQVETAVRQTAALARQTKEQGKTIVAVAGPVVVHTGGVAGLSRLIRGRLGRRGAQRQRAGRARYRIRAVRHLARHSPGGRPPGRARPPQPHARHQRRSTTRAASKARWKAAA